MGVAVGIDFGTTKSCVGVFKDGKIEIIPDKLGNHIFPNYVSFNGNQRVVGEQAKILSEIDPKNTVYEIKRLIGRKFNDDSVQKDMSRGTYQYDVTGQQKDVIGQQKVKVDLNEEKHSFSPEEICGFIFSHLKEAAEAFLGECVSEAVVTVPVSFSDAQRHEIKEACSSGGLSVLRIINDPTAAAIAYGLDKFESTVVKVLVFDLSSRSCDVSVLEIDEGIFEVVSNIRDAYLGGADFDKKLFDHFIAEFERQHKVNIASNPQVMYRLLNACERAKSALSYDTNADIVIDSLHDGINFRSSISRAKFDELCSDLFKDIIGCIDRALTGAKTDKSQIQGVILVGGASRIPKIHFLLEEFFPGVQVYQDINPNEVITSGAASQAAILSGYKHEPQMRRLLLLDVTPLSLKIQTLEGIMKTVIPRNSTIPNKKSEIIETTSTGGGVTIKVFEGEKNLEKDNHFLGSFEVAGIREGQVKLDITFDIDSNGILKVSAKDIESGVSNSMEFSDRDSLSADEISKMINGDNEHNEDNSNTKNLFATTDKTFKYFNQFL